MTTQQERLTQYAMAALAGLCSMQKVYNQLNYEQTAETAFRQADAMIKMEQEYLSKCGVTYFPKEESNVHNKS